jgi:hypothetical protein
MFFEKDEFKVKFLTGFGHVPDKIADFLSDAGSSRIFGFEFP